MDKSVVNSRHWVMPLVLLLGLFISWELTAQEEFTPTKVYSPSLEGNLIGDDPERDVFVYLPPGYENSDKRYPVVYFLHGYAVGADIYVNNVLGLPASAEAAMTAGQEEAILVMPDAFNRYGGSMYSNSPAIGDWESFIAKDLVTYIDAHYRTLPDRASRGLSGHSMGGYGTFRIGMKYPDVFGALYAMSACCLLNTAPEQEVVETQQMRMKDGIEGYQVGTFDNSTQAQAAAWAPNPENEEWYFDLPFQDGIAQPLVQRKWTANSPLIFVDQYVPALKQYRAISFDVGNADGLEATNTQLDTALSRLGVEHKYEIYEGNHGNKVGQRFIENVLPFFAQYLDSE